MAKASEVEIRFSPGGRGRDAGRTRTQQAGTARGRLRTAARAVGWSGRLERHPGVVREVDRSEARRRMRSPARRAELISRGEVGTMKPVVYLRIASVLDADSFRAAYHWRSVRPTGAGCQRNRLGDDESQHVPCVWADAELFHFLSRAGAGHHDFSDRGGDCVLAAGHAGEDGCGAASADPRHIPDGVPGLRGELVYVLFLWTGDCGDPDCRVPGHGDRDGEECGIGRRGTVGGSKSVKLAGSAFYPRSQNRDLGHPVRGVSKSRPGTHSEGLKIETWGTQSEGLKIETWHPVRGSQNRDLAPIQRIWKGFVIFALGMYTERPSVVGGRRRFFRR